MEAPPLPDRAPCGFLLTATGPKYRRLLARAVRSLRAHHPGIPIDVHVDEGMDLPEASRIHVLPDGIPAERPRFHALRTCRFDRVVLLDVDLVVLAPIGDIFDVLDRFDIAGAHDHFRNSPHCRKLWRMPVPDAFPQINGGVLGFRMTDRMRAFIDAWEAGWRDTGTGRDQPALRELLWTERDVRVWVLPPEYNFWETRALDHMGPAHAAPRVLHNNTLALPRMVAAEDDVLDRMMGRARRAWYETIRAADHGIAAAEGRVAGRRPWRGAYAVGFVLDLPGRVIRAAGRRLRGR